jgi:glycopeptide antibiotics resistance protein
LELSTLTRAVIAAASLAFYLLFLFAIAWLRFPVNNPAPNWVPFRTIINDWRNGGWEFVINFLGNIVAFLPLGILPPLFCPRPVKLWQIALFSLTISLVIEAGQYGSARRVSDVDDLILNTIGGMLGYVLSRSGRRLKRRQTD